MVLEIFGRKNVETVGYVLTVTAPGTMAAPFDAYVHRFSNPEQPFVGLADQRNVLTVRFDRIPAGEGVEIRYLMDPAVFTVRGTRQGFQELLEDEARIAGILENQRRFGAIRRNPLWGLIGLAILLWLANGVWQAYNRYGREPDIPSMKYPFEPPSDIPPAAVAAIQTQNPGGMASGPAFHATIMDLARRGYGEFTGKGRKFEMMLDLDKPTEGLESFEADVLDYLKKAAQQRKRGNPNHLEFRELRAYSQKHASRFLTSWRKKPRDWIESRLGGPLTSAESQRAARRWGGRAALAVAVCGISAFLTFGVARIEFIAAGVLCAILGFIAGGALPAWREEVAAEVYGWQGFKRTLTDYTQMKGAPDDFFRLWDRYFVYAASLGVAQQFLKNLNRAAPLAGIDETTLARRGAWMGTGNVSDFASLSRSVTSLSSALSAASASASSGGSSGGGVVAVVAVAAVAVVDGRPGSPRHPGGRARVCSPSCLKPER